MKKIVLLIMLVGSMMSTFAQGIIYYDDIATCPEDTLLCYTDQVVHISTQETCDYYVWYINSSSGGHVNQVIVSFAETGEFENEIVYLGCEFSRTIYIKYKRFDVPNPFSRKEWIRPGETIVLEAVSSDSANTSVYNYRYLWSNGSTDRTIDVSEGTYTCAITNLCDTATRTFVVQNYVDIYRATVDLETNLNKVTWQTYESQAEYISQVKVERDGMVVGTAPYEDGQFLDNIGSENAARNYRITGITTEGDECPISSFQLGTLHVDFSPNANDPNKINMAWTPPYIEEGAPLTVTYFRICKYDPATGEVTVVDQIGANNTIGSYNISLFDGGYATVAAVFSEGKDYEELSFSNMTEDILAVGENAGNQIRIYPNPAKGHFTVEGEGMMHISNVLGQEIMAKEIDGKETVELPQGMYFVKLNGTVRKIVVE